MLLTPGSSHGEAALTSGSAAVVSRTSRSPRRRSSSKEAGSSVQMANAAGPPSPVPGDGGRLLAAPGADEAQDGVAVPGLGDSPGGQLGKAAGQGQLHGGGRGGQAVQVLTEPERPAGVDPQGLEHRVAPDQGEVQRVEGGLATHPAAGHARAGGDDGEHAHRRYRGSRSSRYPTRRSRPTRSWVMVSRSRTVTARSVSESKSTVTQNGVPISSWRR